MSVCPSQLSKIETKIMWLSIKYIRSKSTSKVDIETRMRDMMHAITCIIKVLVHILVLTPDLWFLSDNVLLDTAR